MISHTSCSAEAQVEIGASQTAGTADDSGPYPQVRDLLAGDASTHATLAVVSGLSGGPEAEGEQTLLDTMITRYPGVFTSDRIWVLDRNFPGADRIARMLATGTHGAETALKEAKSATSGMRRSIRRPDPALQNPWAHRSGARRLDLRHRAGPRACSCGRPPSRPRPQGPPRRAASPAPADLLHYRPPRRPEQHPVRRRHRQPAGRHHRRPAPRHAVRSRQPPDHHRPEPAPRPQNQDLPGISRRWARHHHPRRGRPGQRMPASRGADHRRPLGTLPGTAGRGTAARPGSDSPARTHARHAPQPQSQAITLRPESFYER